LASLFPWELGVKADPFAPAPAGIKPEWYFLFMFQSLKYIPATVMGIEGELVGLGFFALAFAAWFFWPVIEGRFPESKRPTVVKVVGITALVFIGVMTTLGFMGL
jgi:cytochrome b6